MNRFFVDFLEIASNDGKECPPKSLSDKVNNFFIKVFCCASIPSDKVEK